MSRWSGLVLFVFLIACTPLREAAVDGAVEDRAPVADASGSDARSDASADAVPTVDAADASVDVADISSPDVTADVVPSDAQDVQDASDVAAPMDVAMGDALADVPSDVQPEVVADAAPDAPPPFRCPVTQVCVEYTALSGASSLVDAHFRFTPGSVGSPGPWDTDPCFRGLIRVGDDYRCTHRLDPVPMWEIVDFYLVSAGDIGFCATSGCQNVIDRIRVWARGTPRSGSGAIMQIRAATDSTRPSVLSWVLRFINQ